MVENEGLAIALLIVIALLLYVGSDNNNLTLT